MKLIKLFALMVWSSVYDAMRDYDRKYGKDSPGAVPTGKPWSPVSGPLYESPRMPWE